MMRKNTQLKKTAEKLFLNLQDSDYYFIDADAYQVVNF